MSRSSTTIEEDQAVATRAELPAIHPGEHLREELAELGLSARAFARALDIPVNRVTQVLNGQRGITADTALRLARYFGTSAEFWLNLQSLYELRRAEQAVGAEIRAKVNPRAA
jgi:addiction module HigA family antidote